MRDARVLADADERDPFGGHLKRAQPVVWERYNPKRIAEIWLQTVKERL